MLLQTTTHESLNIHHVNTHFVGDGLGSKIRAINFQINNLEMSHRRQKFQGFTEQGLRATNYEPSIKQEHINMDPKKLMVSYRNPSIPVKPEHDR